MALPESLRVALEALRGAPLDPPETLRRQVAAHLGQPAPNGRSSTSQGRRRSLWGVALLDRWNALSEEDRGWVQAACRYFARADDDEDDFASVIGFDDDAEVLDQVSRRIGREG